MLWMRSDWQQRLRHEEVFQVLRKRSVSYSQGEGEGSRRLVGSQSRPWVYVGHWRWRLCFRSFRERAVDAHHAWPRCNTPRCAGARSVDSRFGECAPHVSHAGSALDLRSVLGESVDPSLLSLKLTHLQVDSSTTTAKPSCSYVSVIVGGAPASPRTLVFSKATTQGLSPAFFAQPLHQWQSAAEVWILQTVRQVVCSLHSCAYCLVASTRILSLFDLAIRTLYGTAQRSVAGNPASDQATGCHWQAHSVQCRVGETLKTGPSASSPFKAPRCRQSFERDETEGPVFSELANHS